LEKILPTVKDTYTHTYTNQRSAKTLWDARCSSFPSDCGRFTVHLCVFLGFVLAAQQPE
jgi:hypothetical protein